jgi:flagellar hook-associated protein 2
MGIATHFLAFARPEGLQPDASATFRGTDMASIASLGIGSGLDLNGLLKQLTTAEQQKLTPISTEKTANTAKISAYGTLKGALTSLQDAVTKLADKTTYQALASSLSGTGITSAVTSTAIPGSYKITVNSLAQANSLSTTGVADKTSALGTGDLTLTVGGKSATITIDSTNNTLEGIRDAINAQNTGLTASIVNTGDATNPYRLSLTSNTTGTASAISTSLANGTGTVASLLATGALTETTQAKDASLTVNGIDITSQSNTVEGALQGVTLNLSLDALDSAGNAKTQTLTISRDTSSMNQAITTFVNAYNTLDSTTDSLTSYDSSTKKAGQLLGDSTLNSIKNSLRNAMNASVSGSTYSHLSDLGISLQLDGTLKVDTTKLDKAVSGDPSALSKFFAGATSGAGFTSQISSALDNALGDQGSVTNAISGLQSANKRLDDRYTAMQDSINTTIDRYRTQFTQLDTLISQMNSTSTYLTQQFAALSSSSSKS